MSLATNWRNLNIVSSTFFLSQKDGSDSEVGNDPSLPVKTFGKFLTRTASTSLRVRAGVYNEGDLGSLSGAGGSLSIIGDGLVVIDGTGFTNWHPSNRSIGHFNCLIQNFNTVGNSGPSRSLILIDSIVRNCPNVLVATITRSLVIGATINEHGSLLSSTLIDCDIITTSNGSKLFSQSVFDKNCTLDPNASSPNITFRNCALEDDGAIGFSLLGTVSGRIRTLTLDGDAGTIGSTYTDSEKFSGTIAYGSGSIIFESCFWTADLEFNDPASEDYTPKFISSPESVSPLWNNGNLIGVYAPALRFTGLHPAFSQPSTILNNVTINGLGEISITSGSEGDFQTSTDPANCFELPYSIKLSQALQFFGDFDYLAGNWLDQENYVPITNEEVRQTYELQIVDEVTGLFDGIWRKCEVGLIPEIDNTGLGSGDINADMTRLGEISFKRFALRVKLRTNGV